MKYANVEDMKGPLTPREELMLEAIRAAKGDLKECATLLARVGLQQAGVFSALRYLTAIEDAARKLAPPLPGASIEELGLSLRAAAALADAGVRTLGDLAQWTEQGLLARKFCGRKTVKEIKYALQEHGLTLKEG